MRTNKLNFPKLVTFFTLHAATVGYCYLLLPWVWQNLALQDWQVWLVSVLVVALLWIPVLGSISAIAMAHYWLNLDTHILAIMCIPLILVLLVIVVFPDRLVARSRNHQLN